MTKKRIRKSSDRNENKKERKTRSESKEDTKRKSSKNKKEGKCNAKKLSEFTYAELVVLSATLTYSIAQDLDNDDLGIVIAFLGLLLGEVELIVAQNALEASKNSDSSSSESGGLL